MEASRTDCLVIGGGAAGAALALFLARRGVSVTLVDDGRAHYSGPFETVLANTRATWERLGVLDGVEDGVEEDPLRHGALWGDAQLRWRDDPEPGLLLRRGRFDRSLRRAAAAAGADVHEATRAVRVGDAWHLGDKTTKPRLVAYATGRRQGVPGLASYTRSETRTVSVTLEGTPFDADRGTAVVEACRGGWLWSYAPEEGPATAAALLDAPGGRGGLRAAIEALLQSALGPAGRLRERRLLRANDASPRLRAATGDALLLGDCAATIDPLASQGVEKAVAAAEHAATVICSALEEPRWWPRLVRAHALWERDLCAAHWRTSASFYSEERRFEDAPFWAARRAAADVFSDPSPPPPGQLLRWREGSQPGRALLRHGDRFVEVDGLVDPATRDEVARAGRIAPASLFELIVRERSIEGALAAAVGDARFLTSSPRDLSDALHWLHAKGWLVSAQASAPAGR